MMQNTEASKNTYSLKMPATFKGKVLENNLSGLIMNVDSHEAHFRLIGTFNAYNLLAVYGTACLLNIDKMTVLAALSDLSGAPGRFETYFSATDKLLGIIDYAHTPDALINVLAAINQLRAGDQQIITIIGCGGDRDRTKRPIMAEVAVNHSGKAILTTDNPRSEDPEAILDEMAAGVPDNKMGRYLRITDRKEAIKTAVMLARPNDIILVAGKGHETYQEIKGVKYHFDDHEELINAFESLNR
jgi:UDP-N-acetylmuramoyl-L-alanyl-D-glutamate--2,6-diaminopimelate ligase